MTIAKRNTPDGKVQGASKNINSDTLDGLKHNPSHKKSQHKGRRHYRRSRKFARGIASSEFGGYRHFSWSQWAGFQDRAPHETPKRGDAI